MAMFQIGPRACLMSALFLAEFLFMPAYGDETVEFYIKTVHVDGKTTVYGDANHKPEPFPETKMPEGGGLVLTGPDAKGEWKMRAFTFQPAQIVVIEGDDLRLRFVGVQGSSHTIHVEGDGVDERFTLKRGTIKTVNINDARAGIIEIECYDHQPAMNAEVLVLAKTNK